MKLVIIGPVYPYRGGISHHTTFLTEKLRKAGAEVHIISFKKQYPRWLYPGTTDKDSSNLPLQIDANFLLDPLNPLSWIKTLSQIKNLKPNLVIFQWWTTFWAITYKFLCFFLTKNKIKIMFLIHNIFPHEAKFWDSILVKVILSNNFDYIVQSTREQQKMKELLPKKLTYLIEHPIYSIQKENLLKSEDAKEILQINPDIKMLLFFGIVRPYKGLDLLIKSLSTIIKDYSINIRLVIAGEFWEPVEKYLDLISNLSLERFVKIYNKYIPNEEIPIFFSAADVFVAPYKNGTQSGAVKLAMGYGLPLVITNAIKDESMEKLNNIWVVDEYNERLLAKNVILALNNGKKTSIQLDDQWNEMTKIIMKLAS